jgi:hypothetical protein
MVNLELDLIEKYEKILSGYQTNLRRNLNKAAGNKLSISKSVKPEEIISLFKSGKGLQLKHLTDKQYLLVKKIAYESISKGIGETWGAYNEYNELVAGILWVTSHQKSIFLFSSVSEAGKKLHAMPWLINAFIIENAGKPVTLDFEGSNDPGLARFYTSFGAKKVIYQRYVRNSLPLSYRLALKIWQLSRTFL